MWNHFREIIEKVQSKKWILDIDDQGLYKNFIQSFFLNPFFRSFVVQICCCTNFTTYLLGHFFLDIFWKMGLYLRKCHLCTIAFLRFCNGPKALFQKPSAKSPLTKALCQKPSSKSPLPNALRQKPSAKSPLPMAREC